MNIDYKKLLEDMNKAPYFTTYTSEEAGLFVFNNQIPIGVKGLMEDGQPILMWENNKTMRAYFRLWMAIEDIKNEEGKK